MVYTSIVNYAESSDYLLEIDNYNNKKTLYESAEGYVTLVKLNKYTTYLEFIANIDLTSENRVDLGDDLLLDANTLAKEVNFLLTTKGYDCQ